MDPNFLNKINSIYWRWFLAQLYIFIAYSCWTVLLVTLCFSWSCSQNFWLHCNCFKGIKINKDDWEKIFCSIKSGFLITLHQSSIIKKWVMHTLRDNDLCWSPPPGDNVLVSLWESLRFSFCWIQQRSYWGFSFRRNKHGVPQEKIAQMLDRFSFPISVDIVVNSQEPPHVSKRRRADQPHVMRRNQDFH